MRETRVESLAAYERRVLEHLARHSRDGVVPADALTTGPPDESTRWQQDFRAEVVADAKARGLSLDAVDGGVFTVLSMASVVPATLIGLTIDFQWGGLVFVGALALMGWIRARHPQRETPAGLEAASRWLGVQDALIENEVFATHSPLTVELWSRLLAYGAALGVASGASRPLPMGVESDTHAWSAYSGRWRPVRISYPRLWPPGWGKDPVGGGGRIAGRRGGARSLPLRLRDVASRRRRVRRGSLVVAGLGVVLAVALLVMAATDWGTAVEVTGPILRLRTFGGEDDDERHYVAVDDGISDRIRAWRIDDGSMGASSRAI